MNRTELQVVGPSTSGRKRPESQPPQKHPNKRRRFNSSFSSKTKSDVTFEKSSEPKTSGIQMYAAQRTFQIYVGNSGIDMLSKVTFAAMQAKDYKMTSNISQLQLKYVLSLAYCNRITQTSIHYGYALDIPAVSDLKRATEFIQLPGLLVKYIETIGVYKKATGGTVAPYSGGPEQLFPHGNSHQISPRSILTEAGRDVPNNPWCIDYAWIQEWNQHTTRPSRTGMSFSNVNSGSYEGRAEMLVSYRSIEDQMDPYAPKTYVGVAPQTLSEAEGMLGACYGFRNYELQQSWLPGNKPILFAEFLTTEFQPEQYLSDAIVRSFTQ